MKTRLIFTATIIVGSLFITACSTLSPEHDDVLTSSYQQIQKEMTLKQMYKKIMQAGEENGYRMTEYKENEILAEKFDEDHPEAISIKFSKNSFSISPKDDELEDLIEEALQK